MDEQDARRVAEITARRQWQRSKERPPSAGFGYLHVEVATDGIAHEIGAREAADIDYLLALVKKLALSAE